MKTVEKLCRKSKEADVFTSKCFKVFKFKISLVKYIGFFFPLTGVEQLSSLQHLDLAYNLLLEHSQLAPLSLLHCLSSVKTNFFLNMNQMNKSHSEANVSPNVIVLLQLNLEGNPLYFQKTHRTCTVRHLSPKAASFKVSDFFFCCLG